MFEKYITTEATGHMYEKAAAVGYYRIWETANSRYIDADHYLPFLDWAGTPEEVNVDPVDPPDEDKWETINAQKLSLLRSCDRTRIDDVALTSEQKNAWRDYRKDLRDIPTDYADPDDIVWPTKPV